MDSIAAFLFRPHLALTLACGYPLIAAALPDPQFIYRSDWRTSCTETQRLETVATLNLTAMPADIVFNAFIGDSRPLTVEDAVPITLIGAASLGFGRDGSAAAFGFLSGEGLLQRLREPLAKAPPEADTRGATIWKPTPKVGGGLVSAYGAWGFRFSETIIRTGAAWFRDGTATAVLAITEPKRRYAGIAAELIAHYKPLEERVVGDWFSDPPPLPARELWIGALAASFQGADTNLAADAAVSVSRYERPGAYGNLAFRLGSSKRCISIAADSVSGRFIDPDGKTGKARARVRFSGRTTFSLIDTVEFDGQTEFSPSVQLEAWDASTAWSRRDSAAAIQLIKCGIAYEGRLEKTGSSHKATIQGGLAFRLWSIDVVHRCDIDKYYQVLNQSRGSFQFNSRISSTDFSADFSAERRELASKIKWEFSFGADLKTCLPHFSIDLKYLVSQPADPEWPSGEWRVAWSVRLADAGKSVP